MASQGRTGYETTPPDNGGSAGVLFVIEKQEFMRGTTSIGTELSKLDRIAISKKGYRKERFSIVFEQNGDSFKDIAAVQVRAWNRALEDSAKDWGKMISAGGKDYFREIIKSAPNKTKGQGRIDTKLMLNSVKGRTKNLKNETIVAVGWNSSMIGQPGLYLRYFSFQENGTSNGPSPMGAVPKTAAYLSSQFDKSFGKMLEYRMKNLK